MGSIFGPKNGSAIGEFRCCPHHVVQADLRPCSLNMNVNSYLFLFVPAQVRLLLSRSLYRSHVLTTFLGPVLGAMMKQVCWHSSRSKAYRGLPKARGQSELTGTRIYILWGYAHASPQNCLFWGPGFGTSFCSILRPLLATYMGEGFGGSRFRVLYGGEIYCRFWCAELNHFKQQRKALRQASQLCCFGVQMQSSLFSDVALLRPSRRTRQNRNRQQSAASGCPNSRQARICVFPQRGAYS